MGTPWLALITVGGCVAQHTRGRGVEPGDAGSVNVPPATDAQPLAVTGLPAAPTTCPEAALPLAAANTARVKLPLSIIIGGQPLVLDRPMASAPGLTHKVSVLQFFLSAPYLKDGQGQWIAAQFVDDAGVPRPYGLFLFDSDKGLTPSLVLAAPPGTYTGLALGIGLPAPCNAVDPVHAVYPLDIETGLYWGAGLNFLFFRLEGQEVINGLTQGLLHHIGFDASYRTIGLGGAISAQPGASGAGPALVFDLGGALDAVNMMGTPASGLSDLLFADELTAPGVFSLRP